MNVDQVRKDFPVLENKIYLNSAAHGPTLKPVYDSVNQWWINRINEKRIDPPDVLHEAAKLLHCHKEELIQISRVSQGLNMIAGLLDPKKGENIVVTELAYQSNVFVWMPFLKKGAEIKRIPHREGIIKIEDFEKTIDEKTKAVCISEVEWTSGLRYDMKSVSEIAHDHGAYIINDAYQAVGSVDVDVRAEKVDFFVVGSEKWLCCPAMSGIFYIKKEIQDEFEPVYRFYGNVEEAFKEGAPWEKPDHDNISSYKYPLYNDARKFNRGTVSEGSTWGFNAALKYFNKIGSNAIEKRTTFLSQRLIDGLKDLQVKINTPYEEDKRASLVTFNAGNFKLNQKIYDKLLNENTIIAHRYAAGVGGIRVSCHFFNTKEEIDLLLENLSKTLVD
ncbi:aminotransferase class V-fold PLP-dependent enzyme [Candidatus Bathyarchaeota archaeon]|nr:aminotransferase class V-fold PLP-dependent enzyme [Candidatus Bathyarchaeota archaeon]